MWTSLLVDFNHIRIFRSAADYQDETDIFYANPGKFITENILPSPPRAPPTYVVVFDSLLQMPREANDSSSNVSNVLLNQGNYTEVRNWRVCTFCYPLARFNTSPVCKVLQFTLSWWLETKWRCCSTLPEGSLKIWRKNKSLIAAQIFFTEARAKRSGPSYFWSQLPWLGTPLVLLCPHFLCLNHCTLCYPLIPKLRLPGP